MLILLKRMSLLNNSDLFMILPWLSMIEDGPPLAARITVFRVSIARRRANKLCINGKKEGPA